MTNPRLSPPERDPPPDSRPLDLSADMAGAPRRELRQFVGRTAREAPLRRKRIAVACTTSTGEGFILHHLEPNPLFGLSPPPVLKSATSVYPFFHAQIPIRIKLE